MRKKQIPLIILLLIVISACLKDKSPLKPEENRQWIVDTTLIPEMVSRVDSSRIWQNMLHLTSYPNRSNRGNYIDKARDWLYDYLAGNEFSVRYHQYFYDRPSNPFFVDSEHGWMTMFGDYDMRTTNGGASWEAVDIPEGIIYFISPDTGFVVTNEDISNEKYYVVTVDGGQSWQKRADGFGGNRLHFISGTVGWVIDKSMLYATTDGGYHWQLVRDFNRRLHDMWAGDSSHLWIIALDVVYRSTDGGVHWLETTVDEKFGSYGNRIMMNNLNEGILLEHQKRIYYTEDGGEHWFNASILNESVINSICILPPSSAWAIGPASLYFSPNSGRNWQLLSDRGWGSQNYLVFATNDKGWISTWWGLYQTNDGGRSWNYVNDHIPLECTFENVVAALPGKLYPEQEIVLIGHYDTVDNSVGADDNASGLCALLEMAEILSQYSFAYTIRIICFSAEEIGTMGSWHYAREARESGDQIKAVLNFDVIGYWVPGLSLDLNIEYNAESEWLADEVIRVARQYTETETNKHEPFTSGSSDHRRFWDRDYHAIWFDEAGTTTERNPYINKSEDIIDYVNKSFLYENIKIAVAAAADLAVPVKTKNEN